MNQIYTTNKFIKAMCYRSIKTNKEPHYLLIDTFKVDSEWGDSFVVSAKSRSNIKSVSTKSYHNMAEQGLNLTKTQNVNLPVRCSNNFASWSLIRVSLQHLGHTHTYKKIKRKCMTAW